MSQFLPLGSLPSSNVDKKTHNSDTAPQHYITECCEIKGGWGQGGLLSGSDAQSASRMTSEPTKRRQVIEKSRDSPSLPREVSWYLLSGCYPNSVHTRPQSFVS